MDQLYAFTFSSSSVARIFLARIHVASSMCCSVCSGLLLLLVIICLLPSCVSQTLSAADTICQNKSTVPTKASCKLHYSKNNCRFADSACWLLVLLLVAKHERAVVLD